MADVYIGFGDLERGPFHLAPVNSERPQAYDVVLSLQQKKGRGRLHPLLCNPRRGGLYLATKPTPATAGGSTILRGKSGTAVSRSKIEIQDERVKLMKATPSPCVSSIACRYALDVHQRRGAPFLF